MTSVKRTALAGLMVVAMLLVGAYAATGASAAFTLKTSECKTAGTEKGFAGFCWNSGGKLLEFEGEEIILGTLVAAVESLLEATFGEEIAHIECTIADVNGVILQNSPLVAATTISEVIITFENCKLLEGEKQLGNKCEVPTTLKTKAITGTLEEADPSAATVFTPSVGTEFITIEFKSKAGQTCPATVRGNKIVKGKQTCANLSPEVHGLEHELQCVEGGSALTLGENAATFKSTFLLFLEELNDEWDIALV